MHVCTSIASTCWDPGWCQGYLPSIFYLIHWNRIFQRNPYFTITSCFCGLLALEVLSLPLEAGNRGNHLSWHFTGFWYLNSCTQSSLCSMWSIHGTIFSAFLECQILKVWLGVCFILDCTNSYLTCSKFKEIFAERWWHRWTALKFSWLWLI